MLPAGPTAVRVYLIAPEMVCWGLERLVQSGGDGLRLVGIAHSVEASLADFARNPADVVVLDLEGGDADQSVVTLREVTDAKLLVVTASQDLEMLDRAVLAGVRGVVRNNDAPALMLKAIQKIHEGEFWIDRASTGRIFMEIARQTAAAANDPQKGRIASLTVRERRTIAAVTSDASVPAKVIADRLCISEHTLRNHLTSVYSKLGLANRLDLYDYAIRHSLNDPA
jgi:two-component system, NarL family, nitrate/nitrite response regulator NarL